jgi:hypothetical protein
LQANSKVEPRSGGQAPKPTQQAEIGAQ